MTVSSDTSVVYYNGTGVLAPIPIPYRFFKNTDLVVLKRNAAGVTTLLTMTTDYVVTGAGKLNGGTVIPTAAFQIGDLITIARILSVEQLTDLRNQGEYFAEIHEDVFDYLTMLIQQTNEGTNRSLKYPIGGKDYDAQSRRIVNLSDPTADQDAATKHFVDQTASSLRTEISDAVSDEAVARAAADANLQSQLTGNVPLEASAFSEISWHGQTINSSVVIPANKNAWSFGPQMTIAPGQFVTVGANSFWTIANGADSDAILNSDYGDL